MRIRSLLALAAALLAAAVHPLAALAHGGDPASDVLLGQKVFVPYAGGTVSAKGEAALSSVVKEANARRLTIRVAVIAAQLDLGPETAFWLRPRSYAKFLGGELVSFYREKGLLLVAMPNGLGLYHGTKTDQRIVDHIPTGKMPNELVKASTIAVERLGRARGLKLVPSVPRDGSSAWRTTVIAVGGAVILALLALNTYSYMRGPGKQTHVAQD